MFSGCTALASTLAGTAMPLRLTDVITGSRAVIGFSLLFITNL
jgi:hypothetical protein